MAKALAESLKDACQNIESSCDSDTSSDCSTMPNVVKKGKQNGVSNGIRKKCPSITTANGSTNKKRKSDFQMSSTTTSLNAEQWHLVNSHCDDVDDDENVDICLNGLKLNDVKTYGKKSSTNNKAMNGGNKSNNNRLKVKKPSPATSTETVATYSATAEESSTPDSTDTNNNNEDSECRRKIDGRIKAIIASQRRFTPYVDNEQKDSMKSDKNGIDLPSARRIHANNTPEDDIPEDFELFPGKLINAMDLVSFITNTTFSDIQHETHVEFPRTYSLKDIFPKSYEKEGKNLKETYNTDNVLSANDIKRLNLYDTHYGTRCLSQNGSAIDEDSVNEDDDNDDDDVSMRSYDSDSNKDFNSDLKNSAKNYSIRTNGDSKTRNNSNHSLLNSIRNLIDSKRQTSIQSSFEKAISNGCSNGDVNKSNKKSRLHEAIEIKNESVDSRVINRLSNDKNLNNGNGSDLKLSKNLQKQHSADEIHKRALQYEEDMLRSMNEIELKYKLRNNQQTDQSDCESIPKKILDTTDDSSVTIHSDSSLSSWNEDDVPKAVGSLQRIKKLRSQAKKNRNNGNRVPNTFDHIQTRSSLRKTRNRKQLHQQRNKNALFQQYDGTDSNSNQQVTPENNPEPNAQT